METQTTGRRPTRRRLHPLAIGALATAGAVVAAVTAGVAYGAIRDDDGPARPEPEFELHFGPEDREQDLAVPAAPGGELPDTPLNRLDGGTGSLADYRGRPVVVNFFADWCAPCKRELPALVKVSEEVGDDVAFVGIAVQDTVDASRDLVERFGIGYDVLRDPSGDLQQQLEVVNMPTTFFVASDGRVVEVHPGEIDEETLREKVAALR